MTTETRSALQALLVQQNAAPSHLPRLHALFTLCRSSPDCAALALVGSFAQGRGDRISDLDLVCFVADGKEREFMELAHEILSREPVLHQYGRHQPGRVAFRKYVYLDCSSCEFHAFTSQVPFKLRRPFIAIWDPENYLASLVVDEPPPRHEDFKPYPHGDEGLLWELFDCIKWLQRGRTQLAKDYLGKLSATIVASQQPGEPPIAA